MVSISQTANASKGALWAGRILSALPVLMLTIDGVMKLVNPPPVVEAMTRLGLNGSSAVIGILELICVAVHVLPRTALLGAVLLTGYLGGAVATHLRAGSDLFSLVFPVILGSMLWTGLLLRDARLRALVASGE
jgi:hypothetical protein